MARMVKTSIEVDEVALAKAVEILGPGTTQKAAVNAALRAFIRPVVAREFDEFLKQREPQELDKTQDAAWHR